jgi:hypothetical protein
MKQVTSEALKRTMRDDPWFQTLIDPKTLDTQGLSHEFKPTLVETEEEKGFEQNPEPVQLSRAEIIKAASRDRETIREAVEDLGKTNHWSKAEERELFQRLDPSKARKFVSGNYDCLAYVKGGTWLVSAANDDESLEFKLDSPIDDPDSMMSEVHATLAVAAHGKARFFERAPVPE